MPEKDPTTYSTLTYLWVLGLATWGGVAGYIRKARRGAVVRFSVAELLGEIVISAFVGLITFYLCDASQIDPRLTAVMVAISGHMGSRAIFLFETRATRFVDRIFPGAPK